MKKFLILLGILSMTGLSSLSAEKYGVVVVEEVMNNYPAAIQSSEKLRKDELKIQEFVIKARNDLEETPAANKKAKEESYNKQLRAMVQKLQQDETAMGNKIHAEFNNAIKTVATKGGYTLIVPVALYGATDITQDVIKVLNPAYKPTSNTNK